MDSNYEIPLDNPVYSYDRDKDGTFIEILTFYLDNISEKRKVTRIVKNRYKSSNENPKIFEEHHYDTYTLIKTGERFDYLSRSIFYDDYGLITEEIRYTTKGKIEKKYQYSYQRDFFNKLQKINKSISGYKEGILEFTNHNYEYIRIKSKLFPQPFDPKCRFEKTHRFPSHINRPVYVDGKNEDEVVRQIYSDGIGNEIGSSF